MFKFLAPFLAMTACAGAPVKPAPTPFVPEHWIAGVVYFNCGVIVADQLITNEGHWVAFVERNIDPETWDTSLKVQIWLGDRSKFVELAPDCMKA